MTGPAGSPAGPPIVLHVKVTVYPLTIAAGRVRCVLNKVAADAVS